MPGVAAMRRQRSELTDGTVKNPVTSARPAAADAPATGPAAIGFPPLKLALAAACLALGVWAYLPTLRELVLTWDRVPDYSHGFLVIPLAILFLWIRRSTFPGIAASSPTLGLFLLAMSLGLRFVGNRFHFTFMDGWSLVPWTAAIVAVLGGWPLLKWSLPSVGFLIFMIPLPFRVEGELSGPLQRIATRLSTTALQLLGQPAFAQGNVILMGDDRLEVAQACSGLRLFMSIVALTYAYLAMMRGPWWEKVMLALACIPIAIISNSARIVATGLLYRLTDNEWMRHLAHDSAGWAMILFACSLLGLLLGYLRILFVEVEQVDMRTVVRSAHSI